MVKNIPEEKSPNSSRSVTARPTCSLLSPNFSTKNNFNCTMVGESPCQNPWIRSQRVGRNKGDVQQVWQ